MKNIIAVTGMCGSGKTEVVSYLHKKLNWPKIYLGEATFERMEKDGLVLNYANERLTREKIRAELGMGAYAILTLPKVKNLLKNNDNIILESLYSWAEYKIFQKKYPEYFKVITAFASPAIRFERMMKRKNERPMKNKKEFLVRDFSEIEGTDKGGPIARADYTIINESSLKNLHKQINKIIINLQNS